MTATFFKPCCLRSIALGRSTCRDCGTALPVGRVPTPREALETSGQALEDRDAVVERTARERAAVDALVMDAIRIHPGPGVSFTWADLAHTGMSFARLRYAISRLATAGVVREIGTRLVRAGRSRPLFRLIESAAERRARHAHAAQARRAGETLH